MPLSRKQELLRLCRSADIALIEDDVYGDLPHEGPRPLPIKAFDTDERVLLCSSFSKTLAPGMRIGFIAPGRHRDRVRAVKNLMSGATAMLPQETLADYLGTGRYERHLRKLRPRCAEQVDLISQAVQDAFPEGTLTGRRGFVLWGSCRCDRYPSPLRRGIASRGCRARAHCSRVGTLRQLSAAQLWISGDPRYRSGDPPPRHTRTRIGQNALLTTPPSTRSAAPVVADAGTPAV